MQVLLSGSYAPQAIGTGFASKVAMAWHPERSEGSGQVGLVSPEGAPPHPPQPESSLRSSE